MKTAAGFGRWRLCALIVLAASTALHPSRISGQVRKASGPPAGETEIAPSTFLTVDAAEVRTVDQMLDAEAAGVPRGVTMPFRSTMGDAEYQQAKAMAGAAAVRGPRGARPNMVAEPAAAPQLVLDGEGVDQITAGNFIPPDTHGAVGLTQFVEVTNTHLDVYEKADLGTRDLSISLNSFFGYAVPLSDPRAVYDGTSNRWVITVEAFPESPTVQLHLLAISQTSDATGPYFMYRINMNLLGDDLWDYPQLGMDQDSIIVTGNVFGPVSFRGARTFAVAKARLYNGLGFSVPVFADPFLCGTLAPPIVLDDNPNTYLVCARPIGPTVTKYTMTNSSRPAGTTFTASSIAVPFYQLPRSATQPGTDLPLDSLDARFVNASTQIGNSLWQVHTVAFPTNGAPTPRFYEFDTSLNTMTQSGSFFADAFSDDFNASIAVDASNGRAFVTWSSTNAERNINAQVRFGGCKPVASCTIDAMAPPEITSGTFFRFGRWGDYSAITLDPSDPDGAFLVNEYIVGNAMWGSRIAQIRF
jgi:hypothetical protein